VLPHPEAAKLGALWAVVGVAATTGGLFVAGAATSS
jgi:hypothetical protein